MKKNTQAKAKETKPDIAQLDDWHEFIPYYSHYNPHTIFTKNGELLQIIKIDKNLTGKSCENLDGVHASIRNVIRHVISDSGVEDKFSFWLHTIRRKVPLPQIASSKNKISNSFIEYLDEAWAKDYSWDSYYQNEIYITVLHDGENIPLLKGKKAASLIFPGVNRNSRNKYLEESCKILDGFVESLVNELNNHCTAKRLGLYEDKAPSVGSEEIFYSEPMEFLGNILNLRNEKIPLPDVDLSVGLQTAELSFGFNVIESKSFKTGKKRFATMLSLKQYMDSYVEAVDCILQAPIEFIASQGFSFIPAENATKQYKAQKNLFNMSGEVKLNNSFGITQILGYDKNKPIDFCANQISFMIMSDELADLDNEIAKFINGFTRLGLVMVREDIMTEECFWAQLPGNFEFIRRPSPLATQQIAGFCRLNRFHIGNPTGNHWQDYLALIPTTTDSPFFFNFHVGDNGHASIFDFNSFDDSVGKVLEYFLLTKVRGAGARIILFDRNQSARLLFNKMGGSYFTMRHLAKRTKENSDEIVTPLAINPFLLEHSNQNISFLVAWCKLLISPENDISDDDKNTLKNAVEKLYELPQSERNLSSITKLIAGQNPALAEPLNAWIGKGEYAGVFDFEKDDLDMNSDILGIDMTPAVKNGALNIPLFSYLIHRVIGSINNEPTVIVMNEPLELLENVFFAPRLESLLEMLRQRNVVVLFATNKPNEYLGTSVLSAIMAGVATRIYVPDNMNENYTSEELGVSEQDNVMLGDMARQKGHFLLKQNNESTALSVFIKGAEDIVAIFSNDVKGIASARGKFAGLPKDY